MAAIEAWKRRSMTANSIGQDSFARGDGVTVASMPHQRMGPAIHHGLAGQEISCEGRQKGREDSGRRPAPWPASSPGPQLREPTK